MMMKGVEVKCRVINWNNVKGERGKRDERRGEGGVSKYYKHK